MAKRPWNNTYPRAGAAYPSQESANNRGSTTMTTKHDRFNVGPSSSRVARIAANFAAAPMIITHATTSAMAGANGRSFRMKNHGKTRTTSSPLAAVRRKTGGIVRKGGRRKGSAQAARKKAGTHKGENAAGNNTPTGKT